MFSLKFIPAMKNFSIKLAIRHPFTSLRSHLRFSQRLQTHFLCKIVTLRLWFAVETYHATHGRSEVWWRPGQETSLAPPILEPKVFREQMYCIEKSTCHILGTFWHPPAIRRPGRCALLASPRYVPDANTVGTFSFVLQSAALSWQVFVSPVSLTPNDGVWTLSWRMIVIEFCTTAHPAKIAFYYLLASITIIHLSDI